MLADDKLLILTTVIEAEASPAAYKELGSAQIMTGKTCWTRRRWPAERSTRAVRKAICGDGIEREIKLRYYMQEFYASRVL